MYSDGHSMSLGNGNSMMPGGESRTGETEPFYVRLLASIRPGAF